MPKVAGVPTISSIKFYTNETNQSTALSTLQRSQDGRGFRYAKAGATTTVVGNLQQASAQLANFKDMAVQAAAAVAVTTIPVTLGASSTTLNQFKEGTFTVSVTPGIGQTGIILAHDVATNATTCNFTIDEPLAVALTTSSKVSVTKNPYDSVIIMPTTHTGMATGVSNFAIVNATFGWIQTNGVGACLSDATVTGAATMALSASVLTAGCVTVAVAQDFNVGVSIYTTMVSAEVEPIFLTID